MANREKPSLMRKYREDLVTSTKTTEDKRAEIVGNRNYFKDKNYKMSKRDLIEKRAKRGK